VAALLLVGVVLGWRAAGRPRAQPQSRRHVLLITIDTLRADAVGAYGNASARTPWIDRLAAAGARFEQAHAQSVVTLPSHANILSGRYPPEHGVRDNSGFRFPPELPTLATLLQKAGYRTGAFVSAFPLAARFGLGRGFDVYDDSFVDARPGTPFREQERPGTRTVALARRWLDEDGDRPSFCWVHLYEPHYPYEPPEAFASLFPGDPYHGEVAAADAALEPLLEPILGGGDHRQTLVVLTADHGESLGEHGEATHGIFAYEATLRVPLLLYAPGLVAPGVVTRPVRHVDILPTILDALSMPPPGSLPGHSLLPIAAGVATAPTASYFEALSGMLNRGWAPVRGVIRDDGTKYIDLPIPEVYDLSTDPLEARNLAPAMPAPRVDALRLLLAPHLDRDVARPPALESAETRERLASLGYAGAGPDSPVGHFTPDDDPKRLIVLDALLHEVDGLYASGDIPRALDRCRDLVRRRPGMALSWLTLAHLERQGGDLAAGIEALRKAQALKPHDPVVLSLLGAYLTQAGRAGEAARLLAAEAARPSAGVEVLVTYGLALAKLGRGEAALAALDKAREVEPRNAMIFVDVGTVLLMAGDATGAKEAFETALLRNPAIARAHSSLGFMAAEAGRTEEALKHWREALELDPRECAALFALGQRLDGKGRDEGRPYFELFAARAPTALFSREIAQAGSRLAHPTEPPPPAR
jgi:arylsulfatase A-like enzyme/tetratricopeptide (TPR) repeat protein